MQVGTSYSQNTSYIYCFDAVTGTEIWSKTLSGNTVSCLTVWNGMVFVPTWINSGETPLYALDAYTGSIIWENTDSYQGYWDSSPVVVDNLIYINGDDGKTRAIDAMTGITIWEVVIVSGYITATPAYHDGRLYFGDEVVNFHCLNAFTGNTIWSIPGEQHGSSGIADGIVFYGEMNNPDNARVIALDCDTGDEIWSYATGSDWIFSSPAITDGVVYIAGMDWNLYAFGTGLKYTYLDDLFSEVGSNELIVTSFDEGIPVAADTISFTVTGTVGSAWSLLTALVCAPARIPSIPRHQFLSSFQNRDSLQLKCMTFPAELFLPSRVPSLPPENIQCNGMEEAGTGNLFQPVFTSAGSNQEISRKQPACVC